MVEIAQGSALGTSIQTAEIDDGAITSGKIASGAAVKFAHVGSASTNSLSLVDMDSHTFAAGDLAATDILRVTIVGNSSTSYPKIKLQFTDGTNTTLTTEFGQDSSPYSYMSSTLVFQRGDDNTKIGVCTLSHQQGALTQLNETMTQIANMFASGLFTLTLQGRAITNGTIYLKWFVEVL